MAVQARFSIGQLAQIFDVKVPTLRYYAEIGLLTPAFIDPQTHYRYYSTQQFERLNTIKYLRALAVPLNDIRDFFANRDVPTLQELLTRQQERVAAKQAELQQINAKINERLQQIQTATSGKLGVIQTVARPNFTILYLRRHFKVGEDIELSVSALRQQYALGDELFLGKVGISLAQADFWAKQYTDYASVFMLVEAHDTLLRQAACTILPAGKYLQVRFQGSHEMATSYYEKLHDYITQHALQVTGDPLEITLIDYGVTNDLSQYVTEILIPVRN